MTLAGSQTEVQRATVCHARRNVLEDHFPVALAGAIRTLHNVRLDLSVAVLSVSEYHHSFLGVEGDPDEYVVAGVVLEQQRNHLAGGEWRR